MKSNKKLRIFVVEDNIFFQHLIAKQLESLSYAMHFFTSGEDCITALYDDRPDIIVLDNNLQGPLSGLDVVKLIRSGTPDMHIILFSTEKSLNSAENHLAYGKFEYIEKNEQAFVRLKNRVSDSNVFLEKR